MSAADRRTQIVGGWLAVIIGIGVGLAVWWQPQGLRAPAWVAYAAASSFVFAGLALLARSGSRWNSVLAAFTAAGLLVPATWVALGPGPRECTFSVTFFEGVAPGAVCRLAFGIGALGLAVVLVALLVRAGRSGRAG